MQGKYRSCSNQPRNYNKLIDLLIGIGGGFPRLLLFLGPGMVLVSSLRLSPAAVAQLQPLAIKICVNGLLYRSVFSNGNPSGSRTIIDPTAAAIACQNVTTVEEARERKICVNGLLFSSTFSDGNPSGSRTLIEPRAAAIACAPCSGTTIVP